MSNIRTSFRHSNPERKNKYEEGDILLITSYDVGDEIWRTGIIHITEYVPESANTEYGLYMTTKISGNINWICVNAKNLDQEFDVRVLGNVHTDKGWKVLYGSNLYQKQRT